jgi:hypothetical protein
VGSGDGIGLGFDAVRRCVMCVTRAGFAVRARRLTAGVFFGRTDARDAGRRFGLLSLAFDRARIFLLDAPRFNRNLLFSLQLAAEYQKV